MVRTPDRSGLNVGELIRGGVALYTREVLALAHEVCHAAAAFPDSPDDLWITDTGQLLVTPSDRTAPNLDLRASVASLLEAMLPRGDEGAERAVSASLRGLPARLRASAAGVGPSHRRDLMAILSWHLAADPREQIQRLAHRVAHQDDETKPSAAPASVPAATVAATSVAAVDEALELFIKPVSTAPAAIAAAAPPLERKPRAAGLFAALAVGLLFIAIGSGSYWFFRERGSRSSQESGLAETPNQASAARDTASAASATEPAPAAADASLPMAGARPEPLRLDVKDGAFSPAFAADGRELFFHAGHSNAGRLLVATFDDGGRVSRVSAVLDEDARNYHPRVSPDGRVVAFDSDRDGERGVYLAERDGSRPQRVSGTGYAAVPSWSPDMKWLAFVRGEPNRPHVWNLWLRDLASGALRRHTSFRAGQVWGASWFPDGRSLCYSHEEQLVISHLDARRDIVMASPLPGRLVRTPAVSPDGRRVVFQVFKDGVWLLDVRTRSMRRILDDPAAEEFSWTPDGRRIAYHSRRDGAWKIWLMPTPPDLDKS